MLFDLARLTTLGPPRYFEVDSKLRRSPAASERRVRRRDCVMASLLNPFHFRTARIRVASCGFH
jgi:hypothetical protein